MVALSTPAATATWPSTAGRTTRSSSTTWLSRSGPTIPAAVVSTRAASRPTAAPTTSTSRHATTRRRLRAPGPSSSTGPSAKTSALAVPSLCRTTSTPGPRPACSSAPTTTRLSLPRATRAAAPPTSTSRLTNVLSGRTRALVPGFCGRSQSSLQARSGYPRSKEPGIIRMFRPDGC
ncbi:hypothetical protein VTI28DRAFT_8132 [Corynascus sepedonium]